MLTVGNTGYIIKKGYLEECHILAVHEERYEVKSSYYTFGVAKKDMYKTKEAAEQALKETREQRLNNYLEELATKDDFIEFCIQKAFQDAHDSENYDRELILALKQQYKAFFGKEIE